MDSDGAYTGLNQMSIKNGLGWKRWKKEGDKATHPALVAARADGSNGTSSRYLEDGSFFRLRNVTLSYNLPQTFLQKIKMSGARVYVAADNIFTLSWTRKSVWTATPTTTPVCTPATIPFRCRSCSVLTSNSKKRSPL